MNGYTIRTLEGYLKGLATALGGDPAVTHVAALMRVPGYLNVKYPDRPVATILETHLERQFNPSDFLDYWIELPEATPRTDDATTTLLGPLEPVVAGCDFLRWCRDHQAEVSEPLWYALLSNLVRLEGGRAAGHAFSCQYPGYDVEECDDKLDHALAAPGPIGCEKIRELGFRGCPTEGHGVAAPAWLAWPELERRRHLPPADANGAAPASSTVSDTPDEPDDAVLSITTWTPQEDVDYAAELALVRPAHYIDLLEPTELRLGWWCRRFRGDGIRYSPQEGWRSWTGRVWAKDDTRGAAWGAAVFTVRILYRLAATLPIPDALVELELGRLTARKRKTEADPTREIAEDLLRTRAQKALLDFHSRPQLEAVLAIAAAEPPIRLDINDYDRDGRAFTVENGTLDLTQGVLRAHRAADLITKLAPVCYDPMATAPRWQTFLTTVQPVKDQRDYLQTRAGYALTADTREQDFDLFVGQGANGKTTYLRTLDELMGDYATATRAETLLEKKGDTIPNDVAALRGARFVYATEPDVRKRLAEALLKQPGQDTMSARFMRQEFFQFVPTFKLVLSANHRPVIRGTDHAIWRRVRLVPWEVVIPDAQQDKDLLDVLATERSGILNWMLAGCRRWLREGLTIPESVSKASRAYRQAMDRLARFLAEECLLTPKAVTKPYQEPAKTLYPAYVEWSRGAGETPMSKTALGLALRERGFQSQHTHQGQLWLGFRLRLATEAVQNPEPDDSENVKDVP